MATRAKRFEEIDHELQRKEQLIQSKTNQKVNEDQSLMSKLCAMMKVDASEKNVGQCELEHSYKLKATEQKAFSITHHPAFTKLLDVAHLKKSKGRKIHGRSGKMVLPIASQLLLVFTVTKVVCLKYRARVRETQMLLLQCLYVSPAGLISVD